MDAIQLYLVLFGIIVVTGHVLRKSTVPISLILVMIGMLLSVLPSFPEINLNPDIVLDIFLPLLVYQISSFTSWPDVRRNIRSIALLSVGHVIFITVLVAVIMHALLPQLGWGLAFVLGAVISPPDDVAIVSIAEKIRMPSRIITILEGEGLFNDAMALTLFRFSLAAVLTNQFSIVNATFGFFAVIIGETIYGLAIGYIAGELRTRIRHTYLHVIASFLTPFIAYFPAILLGGCGVISTAITGFIIGNRYAVRFTPEFRIVSRGLWPTLAYALESILFLLVGLNLHSIIKSISSISFTSLALYGSVITAAIMIGRFLWVYGAVYFLPRLLFASIRKNDPLPPWQYPFVVSWAGMRGGISLAAALAIPHLPLIIGGIYPRNLIIFLVFCVIAATLLLQGLSLPFVLKRIGIDKHGKQEKYNEHMSELAARLDITESVLSWLNTYRGKIVNDPKMMEKLELQIMEYEMDKAHLKERIEMHYTEAEHDVKKEVKDEISLIVKIIAVEKKQLLNLYRDGKISLDVRNKLLSRMDHKIANVK